MRAITLLPAATDIVAALGAEDQLVGITHECDYPARVVRQLPRVTGSPIAHGSARDVDQAVREAAHQGVSLFTLDEAKICALRPNIIFTQALCDVCAVNEDDVRALAARLDPAPRIVTLNGTTFDGVFDDIASVARALDLEAEGAELIAGLHARLRRVEIHIASWVAARRRPRVVVIEWTDPLYLAGHWVPEMIARAGGVDAIAKPGEHSTVRTVEQIRAAHPDVLIVAPCGYDLPRASAEAQALLKRPEWAWARTFDTFALDANALTSRPGPRIVDGVEAIAAAIYPQAGFSSGVSLGRGVASIVP